jgi:hypothetical protein
MKEYHNQIISNMQQAKVEKFPCAWQDKPFAAGGCC